MSSSGNPWSEAWQRLRRNRAAVISLIVLAVIGLVCLVLPSLPNVLANPNTTSLYDKNLLPGGRGTLSGKDHLYLLGSDQLGRDLLARTLYGGRISIAIALITALVSVTIGTIWGSIAGYFGGWIDSLMMRIVDILYALPFLIIVILVSVSLQARTNELTDFAIKTFGGLFEDPGHARANLEPIVTLVPLFLAIGALSWLSVSRIIRASVQGQAKMEYVDAARSLGLPNRSILARHILPNVLGPVIVYTTLTIPSIMLFEAALSFLGVGVRPPNASWGSLIQEGADRMLSTPYLLVAPSLCFIATLLSLNFLGDGLRDALDVRSAKD